MTIDAIVIGKIVKYRDKKRKIQRIHLFAAIVTNCCWCSLTCVSSNDSLGLRETPTTAKKGIQALGQGIHALQDAVAHQGTDMEHHSIWNDMRLSKRDYNEATAVTEGAVLVTEIMSGNGSHLSDGMSINVSGMNREQFNTFISAVVSVMNQTEGVNKLTLQNKSKN